MHRLVLAAALTVASCSTSSNSNEPALALETIAPPPTVTVPVPAPLPAECIEALRAQGWASGYFDGITDLFRTYTEYEQSPVGADIYDNAYNAGVAAFTEELKGVGGDDDLSTAASFAVLDAVYEATRVIDDAHRENQRENMVGQYEHLRSFTDSLTDDRERREWAAATACQGHLPQ